MGCQVIKSQQCCHGPGVGVCPGSIDILVCVGDEDENTLALRRGGAGSIDPVLYFGDGLVCGLLGVNDFRHQSQTFGYIVQGCSAYRNDGHSKLLELVHKTGLGQCLNDHQVGGELCHLFQAGAVCTADGGQIQDLLGVLGGSVPPDSHTTRSIECFSGSGVQGAETDP